MAKIEKLGEEIKRYGYERNKKIKLYGKELELVSDPVNPDDDIVVVEAREKGSDNIKQVQVPRNIIEMAKRGRRNNSK